VDRAHRQSRPVRGRAPHGPSAHPLPDRADPVGGAVPTRAPLDPRGTAVRLAHLGHAFAVALTLEIGVVVVHAYSSSRFGSRLPWLGAETGNRGEDYAFDPKNGSRNTPLFSRANSLELRDGSHPDRARYTVGSLPSPREPVPRTKERPRGSLARTCWRATAGSAVAPPSEEPRVGERAAHSPLAVPEKQQGRGDRTTAIWNRYEQ